MRHTSVPSRLLLAVVTSLAGATTVLPASAAPVESALTAAHSTSGPLSATLTDDGLLVSWAPQGGDRAAVFDEHHAEFIYRGRGLATTVPVERGGSAALTVYRITDDGGRILGRIQAMRTDTDSSLSDVVSVTSPDATGVGVGTSEASTPWKVTAGGAVTHLDDLTSTTIPLQLGSVKQIELTSSTVDDGGATFLSEGLRLSTPMSYSLAASTDAEAVPANVVTNTLTQMFYDTFIPDPYADAPDSDFIPFDCEAGDGSNYSYGGDGITDEFNSNKFRTRAKTSWSWGVRSQGAAKWVNPTHRYIKNGDTYTYESKRTASDQGFTVQNLLDNGVEGRGAIQHAVGNPYCSSKNNIDYNNANTFYKTGGWDTQGKHDQMPNHKQYRYDSRSDGTEYYQTIFLHRLKDAKCLNVYYEATACHATEYQYSK